MENKKKQFKGISLYISPELQKKLRQLALDEETTVTALGKEAVNLLFQKRENKNI